MLRFASSLAAGLVLLVLAAPAGATLINNGLAPPNPANVIDTLLGLHPPPLPGEDKIPPGVRVQNVGCDSEKELEDFRDPPSYPCNAPGDPTSVVLVDGGTVWYQAFAVYDSSTAAMIGGVVKNDFVAAGTAAITMSGGQVGLGLAAFDFSTVAMSGGSAFYLLSYDSSTVTMSGGSLTSDILAGDSSTVTQSGGAVGADILAYDSATVTMSGGSVGADILAYNSSNITIVGSGFAVDNVPVPDGPIAATSGVLTGTLESGEPIDNRFCHSGSTVCGVLSADGLITLAAPLGGFAASIPDWVFAASIPEPDSALLFSAALLSLAVLRVRARSRGMQITREP